MGPFPPPFLLAKGLAASSFVLMSSCAKAVSSWTIYSGGPWVGECANSALFCHSCYLFLADPPLPILVQRGSKTESCAGKDGPRKSFAGVGEMAASAEYAGLSGLSYADR